jgi:hypothetical protein
MLKHTCVLLAAATLSGCGWFDSGNPSPLQSQQLRPGADRLAPAIGLPPAPQRGTYDGGQAPLDEGRSQPVGTVVAAKGGQRAQLELKEKERVQQETERKRDRTTERRQTAEPSAQPADSTPDR